MSELTRFMATAPLWQVLGGIGLVGAAMFVGFLLAFWSMNL